MGLGLLDDQEMLIEQDQQLQLWQVQHKEDGERRSEDRQTELKLKLKKMLESSRLKLEMHEQRKGWL